MTPAIKQTGGIFPTPPPPDKDCRISMPQQLASAWTGAILTSMIVTPLDVVKVRLQTQQKTLLSNKCYLYCNGLMDHLCPCDPCVPGVRSEPQLPKFTGTVDALFKISRSEGIGSLWSGLGPTLVLAVPSTMIYFVSYENIRLFFKDKNKGIQPVWGPLIAGMTARVWAATVVSPIELCRTKMQSKRLSYKEMHEAIKMQLKDRGIWGLWRGVGSTLLRDVPFSGIYWLSYENFKNAFTTGPPSFLLSFLGGALSGTVAATVTTPFDVVKTHQQIEIGEKEIYSGKNSKMTFARLFGFGTLLTETPSRGASLRTVIGRIYSENGVRGLFAGLTPRLVKVAPSCAIMISSFEYGKNFFCRYNKKVAAASQTSPNSQTSH
ncbi:hypothetical protein R5R35_002081 [Gryllus longicercus]|uniref:Solute carrier family 25 member 40 n=1 Tax=Gryllus longicercus TaxID=2509291 RepID=A0AAN9V3X6_9ORTH